MNLHLHILFCMYACVTVISLFHMNLVRMLAMHRVDTRLVTRVSSRAAKRLNDKRATGINLSSFPGWWSGNFLLIVGGNRVCRPVDQTLNSSLLRCALLPIRLPNGYTASTNRCCTVCTPTTIRALLARESRAYCMDWDYLKLSPRLTIINAAFKYGCVTRNHLIILFYKIIFFFFWYF